MDVNEAKNSFVNLLNKFTDECKHKEFLEWIHTTWPSDRKKKQYDAKLKRENVEMVFKDIVSDLRRKLPADSILPSENIMKPDEGENSDCLSHCTQHIDSFLYDDENIDEMVEEGVIARNFCVACGSRKTEPLIFISHSVSRQGLAYIFTVLLPPLESCTVLDVGSRLGAMLYGAYLYTKATNIVGVEMNKDFCRLQEEIIQKHGFQDRVHIIENNIMNVPNVVHSADVIILHNVFEFFLPKSEQEAAWRFLRNSIKPGAAIVTNPPLITSLKNLNTGIDLSTWVETLPPYDQYAASDSQWQDETWDVSLYRVLS